MSISARDIMQGPVIRVAPEDPLIGVQRLFDDEQIHGAPVVDEQGRVLGVISSSDLLRAATDDFESERPIQGYYQDGVETGVEVLDEALSDALDGKRVSDAMTEDIVSVEPGAGIAAVARTLRANRVHRVLVMEQGALLGIISSFDLLELLEDVPERATG